LLLDSTVKIFLINLYEVAVIVMNVLYGRPRLYWNVIFSTQSLKAASIKWRWYSGSVCDDS